MAANPIYQWKRALSRESENNGRIGLASSIAAGNDGGGAADTELTPEELTILALMAQGLGRNAVGAHLGWSPRTVSRRVRCVCDRLGVEHPIEAVVWAARRGLI